jgi:TatD DNase family protein
MSFSDCHCHLETYQPELLAQVLKEARKKHVDIMVSVGSSLESSAKTVELAQSCEGVVAAVGIHPWWPVEPDNDIRRQLGALAKKKHVVAIGEIGLDYAQNPQTKGIQREVFIYQLSLARETGLPVNIHCIEAHNDMMDILHNETCSGLKGVIHAFSGNLVELKDWLDLGFYVSFGVRGFVTNEAASLEAVARETPSDRLLTETDSLSLPNQQLGEPADVVLVVQKLAYIRGANVEDIASATSVNLKRLLKL